MIDSSRMSEQANPFSPEGLKIDGFELVYSQFYMTVSSVVKKAADQSQWAKQKDVRF